MLLGEKRKGGWLWVAALGLLCACGVSAAHTRRYADLSYPYPTEELNLAGVQVAYTDVGTGETTLLLVHGLGSYIPTWRENLARLAETHRVVAIDLPGFGRSSKGDHDYSMAFYAEVVQAVMQRLELERVVLVGHSMGAQIALAHALRWPGAARALVLTSPAGIEHFSVHERKAMRRYATQSNVCALTEEKAYRAHAQSFHGAPQVADFMYQDALATHRGPEKQAVCRAMVRSVRGMVDAPVDQRLSEVKMPALVVFAQQDPLIPNPMFHGGSTARMAERGVLALPHGELVLVEGAGHFAHLERARRWNRAVLDFVQRLP